MFIFSLPFYDIQQVKVSSSIRLASFQASGGAREKRSQSFDSGPLDGIVRRS
jgi:hypothetical protein